MIIITCTYNKLTRDYGTCRIDGAKNYKQARYATGGEPNYPMPAVIPDWFDGSLVVCVTELLKY